MNQKLEIRLLNYFTLIILAASLIAMEFFFEINNPALQADICSTISTQASDNISNGLLNLRNKIMIMIGILTLVFAIIMMMFIKNIAIPLKHMAASAKIINDGDLTEIITIENHDEIGLVGDAINELTSNLQECAAITHTTSSHALICIRNIEDNTSNNELASIDDIEELKSQLELLNTFSDSFKLLQTDIKNGI